MLEPPILVAMFLKKIGLLFLLVSASLLSTSSFAAGRQSHFVKNYNLENTVIETHKEVGGGGKIVRAEEEEEEAGRIHERLLRVNTKDYGKYDPAPALVKPPFKLIPN